MNIPLLLFAWVLPITLLWLIGVITVLCMRPSKQTATRQPRPYTYNRYYGYQPAPATWQEPADRSYYVSYRSNPQVQTARAYMPSYSGNRMATRRLRTY